MPREVQQKQKRALSKDVTDNVTDKHDVAEGLREFRMENTCTWKNMNEEIREDICISEDVEDDDVEIVELCECNSQEMQLGGDNLFRISVTSRPNLVDILSDTSVPDAVIWSSILSAFENCTDYEQLEKVVFEIKGHVKPLGDRVPVEYCPEVDVIDRVAQKEIPPDGLVNMRLKAIKMLGDGNCLLRSTGKSYFNDPERHVELRARLVMEAVINKEKYLSHSCLERGATYLHSNADLPTWQIQQATRKQVLPCI